MGAAGAGLWRSQGQPSSPQRLGRPRPSEGLDDALSHFDSSASIWLFAAMSTRPTEGDSVPKPRFSFNASRSIFLSWVGIILIASSGYFYIKTNNLAKRKELMQIERTLAAQADTEEQAGGEDEARRRRLIQEQRRAQAATTGSADEQKSPLQSLLDQINRQTTQRRRAADS